MNDVFGIVRCVFLVLVVAYAPVRADDARKIEVIDAIKAFDSLYLSAIYADGVYSCSGDVLRFGGDISVDTSFPLSVLRFTKSKDRFSMIQQVEPDKEVREELLIQSKKCNNDSAYRAFLNDGQQAFFKDNKILDSNRLHVQNTNSSSFLLQPLFVLFAMGRGAVIQINDLTDFQVNENAIPKTISIKGKGSNLVAHGRSGIWEVEVLPDAGYMLKKAKFYYEGIEGFHYMVETSGVVNKDNCFYPESATILLRFAREYMEHKYQFANVRFEFDNRFYDEIKSLIDDTSEQTGTYVIDDSKGKTEVHIVGAIMHKTYELSPAPKRRWGVIIGVNFVLFSWLVYAIYRDRKAKQQKP